MSLINVNDIYFNQAVQLAPFFHYTSAEALKNIVEKTCMNIKRLCTVKGLSPVDIQDALALESVQAVYKWYAGKSVLVRGGS